MLLFSFLPVENECNRTYDNKYSYEYDRVSGGVTVKVGLYFEGAVFCFIGNTAFFFGGFGVFSAESNGYFICIV